VNGNHSQNNLNLNDNGNRNEAFPVDTPYLPTTTDAITAARDVKAQAGARGPNFGLDATDDGFIEQISIP
jgi:hypothetical protein